MNTKQVILDELKESTDHVTNDRYREAQNVLIKTFLRLGQLETIQAIEQAELKLKQN